MLSITITNAASEPIGPGEAIHLPYPFEWFTLLPGESRASPVLTEDLSNVDPHTGFTYGRTLQQLIQSRVITVMVTKGADSLLITDETISKLTTGGGGGLPPFSGEQFAALIENPASVAVFQRLTEDMILPGFAILSFAVSPTVKEIGDSAINPSFTAAYVRSVAIATLDDGGGPVLLTLPATSFIKAATYMKTGVNASQSFVLAASEAGGSLTTASCAIAWRPLVFFGVAVVPGVYDEAFIEGLASNALAPSRQRVIPYNAPAGQKLYYCYPDSYGGVPTNFIDVATGFAAGFSKVATVSVTNSFGVTVTYAIWESDQTGLGSVSIRVT